jgi:hypothetical protein
MRVDGTMMHKLCKDSDPELGTTELKWQHNGKHIRCHKMFRYELEYKTKNEEGEEEI